MHPGAVPAMLDAVKRRTVTAGDTCLDVGSLDINGNYRGWMEEAGYTYTGLDITPGPNVDVVTKDPYTYPYPDNSFDLVISGSTMEHVEHIWRWIPELVRLLKPGGLLAILTHWRWEVHAYPLDCWRILPDGMNALFAECPELRSYVIQFANENDIIASAFKIKPKTAKK